MRGPGEGRILPAFREVRATLSRDEGPRRQTERSYLKFAGVGIQYGVTIALFTLGGVWLDGKVPGLRPLFTVLGVLLGFAGATASLIFQVTGPRKRE